MEIIFFLNERLKSQKTAQCAISCIRICNIMNDPSLSCTLLLLQNLVKDYYKEYLADIFAFCFTRLIKFRFHVNFSFASFLRI